MTDKERILLKALECVKDWNNADIRGFEDIAPSLEMLKSRRRLIRQALNDAKRR